MALWEFRNGSTVGDKIVSYSAKIIKNELRKPNILKFGTKNGAYALGDEVKYYDKDDNFIFGGEIQNVGDGIGITGLEVADYSIKASQTKVNEVYTDETISALVTDLITTYTDWTITTIDIPIVTLPRFVFRDEWLSDALNKVLELVNGTYEIDKNKNIKFFVKSGAISTGVIDDSRDVLDRNTWSIDNDKRAEKVIVRGAIIDQRTTETLSGTGTEFFTTRTPENVQISGLVQTTSTINGDYVVDKENKKITFNTSKTDPEVSYTYKSQIRVEAGEGKVVELEKKYLETRSEARRLAREYLARFEDGAISSKWIKQSSELDKFNVGELIQVNNPIKNRTGTYEINKVEYELPNKMIIHVGDAEDDLFDQEKETIERIKQLEKVNQNQDFITRDIFLTQSLTVNVTAEITKLQGIINDGLILWSSETELATGGDIIYDEFFISWFKLDEASYVSSTNTILDSADSITNNNGTLIGWSPETLWQELNRANVDFVNDVTIDSSESGLDGTMVGFSRNDGAAIGGVTISDGAIVFDGTGSNRIDLSNSTVNIQGFSIWLETGTTSTEELILSGTEADYFLFKRSNNQWASGIGGTFNIAPIDDNTLTHLAGYFTGTEWIFYKNGVQVATRSTTANYTINKLFNRQDNTRPFIGSSNVVQLFSSSFNEAKITEIYNTGKDAYSPISDGLVGQWSGKDTSQSGGI